jgi:endo-1,4-beta-xylanase
VHGKGPDDYDFSAADKIVDFAGAHGMKVRGHNLVWYKDLPGWLTQGRYTPDELSEILHKHIRAVAGHFRGKVYCWDVVNEAFLPRGQRRPSLWAAIGDDYMIKAFRWAREADPSARLFYNDQGLEWAPDQVRAVDKLVSDAKAAGAPIDGIGLQMHTWPGKGRGDITALIVHFAEQGLEVHVTEMDVALDAPATVGQLEAQADVYTEAMNSCLAVSACKAFVMWGFTDKYTFLAPKIPLIFDKSYAPKKAYAALGKALSASAAPPP